ncbi:oligosaccharide flippase family protein [Mucilaginibacter xinganensis]|uniref:Uncharacterized protein n=1 Tax=Mucilaginibacter xinganensis TaxID=1234841 RepID=A0A223NZ63_9SPHI|nr:oligosaccharide flippase family protein [Mucilaginibacter xinganensis]ASU35167.1 hypothetical protein MuYL_3282 [Mucilaginibacter xinganensis]
MVKIFSSGLQAISVQLLGALFFYFISIFISKDEFGIISWTNAASVFITTLLGFGLEQVVVRRIAASQRSDWAAAAFFLHSLTAFLITFLFLLLLNNMVKSHAAIYRQLPWFFLAQGLVFLGVPLKQFLNAKEQFTPYGIIAVVSNICKIAAAWLLMIEGELHLKTVLIILICTALFELTGLAIYLLTKTDFSFKFHFNAYTKLVKESAAQYVSVVFDISLSRMDWILLGIMAGSSVLADYSFAYRAYELARLPMLILAPLILPRFSRLLSLNTKIESEYQQYLNSFYIVEMFFAAGIPLILNILWVPLLGMLTNGKYGVSNSWEFLILSLCIPLQFFINMLWSLSFAAKKYKAVSYITVTCAITNILLNLILISKWGGLGASVAFFATTVLQGGLYFRLVRRDIISISLRPIIVFAGAAVIVSLVTTGLHLHFLVQLAVALVLYLVLCVALKLVNKQHLYNFKHLLSK